MYRFTIIISLLLATTCCADATDTPSNALKQDSESLVDRLNRLRERPEAPNEWGRCDVESFGGIEPVHACSWPRDGYAPKCVWQASNNKVKCLCVEIDLDTFCADN